MSRFDQSTWDAERERQIHKHLKDVGMLPPEPMPSAVRRPVLHLVDDNVVHVDFRNRRRTDRYLPSLPTGGAA
jgi:hypothetical protein